MPGLRDILDAATPAGWEAQGPRVVASGEFPAGDPYIALCMGNVAPTDGDANARLIALAPELAALALDMGEFIRNVCDPTDEWESSLLARLDQLGKEPSDG